MTDETLFAEALEKGTAAERANYLNSACDTPEQRARLDSLLAAHDRAGSFLGRPAVAADSGGEVTHTAAPDDAATRTTDPDAPADDADATAFLAPPGRPDSLGRLGHYEVLAVLGRGGFGIVYRAFDTVLQRVVAVKVLAPHMAATSPARKRFLREARSAAVIQHEHVVRIHETGETPLPYLVMEFVPGDTLQQRMDRTGPLEVAEVLKFARQIAAGLAAAHAKGLIHRDIKPSNVLIDAGPQQAKITDFGLARAADDASLTRSGTVAGTPMYMAPEQARGEALDQRADLFSLGSVMYALLTGHPPFRAANTPAVLKRVAEDDPRPIREVIPEVPEWVCRIVGKLHAKNPADRFQTAREVADLLADCEKQLAERKELTDFSRIPGGKPQPKRRRVPAVLRVFVGLCFVVLAGFLGSYFWPGPFGLVTNSGHVWIQSAVDTNWQLTHEGEIIGQFQGFGVEVHTLKPGRYSLTAARPGDGSAYSFRVTREAAFGGMTIREAAGDRVEFAVARGDKITIEVLPTSTSSQPNTADGFTPLFNGKDLTGWKELPAGRGSWAVENGVLVGYGKPSHLFTERGDFTNFHLRMELRVRAGAKSGAVGLFGRVPAEDPGVLLSPFVGWKLSRVPVPRVYDEAAVPPVPPGYRDKPMLVAGGALTGEGATVREFHSNDWHWLELIAEGPHLTFKMLDLGRGTGVSGVIEAGAKAPSGHLALQLFDYWSEIEFRKIEIKELPASAQQPGGSAPHSDADRLKGEWLVVSAGPEGKLIPVDAPEAPTFRFGSDEYAIVSERRPAGGKWQIDPARHQFSLEHPTAAPLSLAVGYRFDGDRLRLTLPAGAAMFDFVTSDRHRGQNNLKTLAFGAANYQETFKSLPPAGLPAPTGSDLTPRLSWRVALLPFVDEAELYKQFRLDEPWDSEHNEKLIGKMPNVYSTPGLKAPPGHTHYRAFSGPGTALEPGRNPRQGPKLPADFTDGTANTLLFVEADEPTVWTKPDDLTFDPKKPLPKLREVNGGVNVVFADGASVTLKAPLPDDVLRALVTRNGGEVVQIPVWSAPAGEKGPTVLECVRKGAPAAPPGPPAPPPVVPIKGAGNELPAVKSPLAVPTKAADVLPFLAGTWKAEWKELDPKLPPAQATGTGHVVNDFVANGHILRGRSSLRRRGNDDAVLLHAYDPAANALRVWQARSTGHTSGPTVTAYNPESRTLTWTYLNGGAATSSHQFTFVDGNTVAIRLHHLDGQRNMTHVATITLTRVREPVAIPDLPLDPNRPDEMKVLDRLAGEWQSEQTVTNTGRPGVATVETSRVKSRLVLGGRFVEQIESFVDGKPNDYSLSWYDPAAKRYRRWYFTDSGRFNELSGTWDQATKTMTLSTTDDAVTAREVFATADRSEFRITVKGEAGKLMKEITGVARRVAADKK